MKLTDEIRNYSFTKALSRELMKTSDEYYILGVLKYCDPEVFSSLRKTESPDLQNEDGSLGIEITNAISESDQQITGESLKYSNAKTDAEREEALRIIRRNGGDRDRYTTSYPVGTADKDKDNIKKAYDRKLKKISEYRKKCSRVGLAITIDIPLFFFQDTECGKWLYCNGKDNYDFVILSHWSGIDSYDMVTGEHKIYRIDRDDMDALKRLGRMTAEGIIKDNDPVWTTDND